MFLIYLLSFDLFYIYIFYKISEVKKHSNETHKCSYKTKGEYIENLNFSWFVKILSNLEERLKKNQGNTKASQEEKRHLAHKSQVYVTALLFTFKNIVPLQD